MKQLIKKIPVLRSVARAIHSTLVGSRKSFPGSEDYWKQRYSSGGTSGAGSYDKLAEFKAEILNRFVEEERIGTIIEFGCGDGNQLRLSRYPSYLGLDVSPDAISRCRQIFSDDATKTFLLMDAFANQTAQLTLSLDVIYHLVEDDVYDDYMKRLFDSATRFVIVYSTDTDAQAESQEAHVRHRTFSTWIVRNRPEWKLIRHLPNRHAQDRDGSPAEFFIYHKD